MGHNQSKARNKGPSPPTTERLYPNLAGEFPTYGAPPTVDFRSPPAYSREACFGNTIPTFNNGQSYHYNPAPSAPSEILPIRGTEVSAIGQCLAKQECGMQTTEVNKKNDDINRDKKPCLNAGKGCILHFNQEEMKQHVKECLFMDIVCPLNGLLTNCAWEDTVKNLPTHFKDNHPENIGQVNQEKFLTGVRTIHLVVLKPYKFLVHIKVDEAMKRILVAVQHYNTQFRASKWFYEFLIETSGPNTQKKVKDTCVTTAGVLIEDKFNKLQCRVLPMNTNIMCAFKNGGLKYKYRIMQKGNRVPAGN